jgi:sterol desaturase/sphingolipid hydroxylase (fatty acid hydroxylase superfamily)
MLMWWDFDLHSTAAIVGTLGAIMMIGRQLEKKWPIVPNLPRAKVLMDIKLVAFMFFMNWLIKPLVAVSSAALINAAGGGLIELPSDTWWRFAISVLVFLVVSDFYAYWYHRMSHKIPALWAMHSFHHSAEALTYITGARHLWMESAFNLAILPATSLLFKAQPEIIMATIAIGFLPNSCAHLNVRVQLGWFSTWLNSPQWHRIHHSTDPRHFDKNFAAVFPIWDLVFGTAWIPAKDEFPPAGLVPDEQPGFYDALIWPFRKTRPAVTFHHVLLKLKETLISREIKLVTHRGSNPYYRPEKANFGGTRHS